MRMKLFLSIFSILCLSLSLSACKEEAKVEKPAPVKEVFNPDKVRPVVEGRIVNVNVDANPIPENSDYIRLVAHKGDTGNAPGVFLSGLTSDDTKAVIILAHINNGEDLSLPSVPLFIYEKDTTGWVNRFQAEGSLSPFFVAQRAPLNVSLEMVLLKDALKDLASDAQSLVEAYGSNLALYSREGAHEISSLADAFSQRIALVEEAALKDIAEFSISYLENFANAINLSDANQAVTLSTLLAVEGKASMLPMYHERPLAYSQLLAHKIGIHSPRSALEDLEAGFWSVPADALRPSCQAVHGALRERLGLSERDSALVLWRMMQPHALFANEVDYQNQCSGEDMAALLNEMGFTLPPAQPARASSKTQNAMNSKLSQIARLIKNAKDADEKKLAQYMGPTVLVRDQARLLFSTDPDQVVSSANDVVAPTLERDIAAQYLMMMPIKAYGCYARGTGQVGHHRSTLLTLENDPALWLLDFAFNKENKISGIQLRKPSQKDFCRAIGGRKGNNRCTFSGQSFPGLTPDKCG